MSWQGIEGHDDVVAMFRRCLARDRLASTFLFLGPDGIGKRTFAWRLAQTLLCSHVPPEQMAPCGECDSCRQVLAQTHPDMLTVSKPPDKNVLPIELFVGPREKRMQAGLCHDIGLKPFMGGRKVAIIDDADDLNVDSANCLLKTLEEPPPRSVIILIATSEEGVLPTIRSRSQIIRFRPLVLETIVELLLRGGQVGSSDEARRLAELSEGSLAAAAALADPDLWTFREELLAALEREALDSIGLAARTAAFIDAAGREAPARRARARQIVLLAADYFRRQMRRPVDEDGTDFTARDPAWAADCLDRCLEAIGHIDRYAYQAAWLECWLDDLASRYTAAQTAAR